MLLYLIYLGICVGIFYICALVVIVIETNANETSNYFPRIKRWVMWQSMRESISKILEGWTRAIYEKVQ